ncbi:hypothetical protein [Haloarcula laminariae]|uniref:hypothetical protein n=1 Tax=Haloarcula laminariae TaxID=2961577 RepID=UPI00240705F4|nr:hypothetical protein [Halomicroarcula sp. FL173]
MEELQIYDSQGKPIRSATGRENQQVKDFFFDGVRLAVDAKRNEMFCFFRARDNDTARSEQYYAKYSYRNRSEMNRIYKEVKTRIEEEYGMILDTENEDTRFFELIGSSESGRVPTGSDLDDVTTILSEYKSARVGVGSYNEAYGLFSKLFNNEGVSKIAVSDNATGQSLSAYDLVIEKGDYFGLALLGDTEEKVKKLREQRQPAFESKYEEEDDDDDDNDLIAGLMGASLYAGISVALFLAIIYGSCLGLGIGLIGDLPGATCGSPSFEDVNADAVGNGSQEIRITGGINGGPSDTDAQVNVTVRNESGMVFNDSSNRRLNSSGNFNFTVQPGPNLTSLSPGNYTATVEYGEIRENDTFTFKSGPKPNASQSENESTPTATESESTPTATESESTPTATESESTPTATEN